jgi:N-hydroxyarylamine O-acetyltransferase
MSGDQIERYLARLAVERMPPSVEALFALHRAHIERIPYETTWIHLGEQRSIDPNASIAHLVDGGRGGYCFHLNGALAALLDVLGYDVAMHVGGVHGETPDEATFTNHMVLTVSGLPTDVNPAGTWYVDTGLGDALHEPLPLLVGTYRQGPMEFELSQPSDGIGDWRFTHDPNGSFASMSWHSRHAVVEEFVDRHTHLSTSPESGFVKTVCAQRRDATTMTALRALTLTTITASAKETRIIDDRAQWFATLSDVFDLRFRGVSPDACDRLWRSAHESHRRHQAATSSTDPTGSP